MRRRSWLPAVLLAFLVTSLEAAQQPGTPPLLKAGQSSPNVDMPGVGWEKVLSRKAESVNLKDFIGKKNVVLFFYPKAMTLG